jgi:hypothetical protein
MIGELPEAIGPPLVGDLVSGSLRCPPFNLVSVVPFNLSSIFRLKTHDDVLLESTDVVKPAPRRSAGSSASVPAMINN